MIWNDLEMSWHQWRWFRYARCLCTCADYGPGLEANGQRKKIGGLIAAWRPMPMHMCGIWPRAGSEWTAKKNRRANCSVARDAFAHVRNTVAAWQPMPMHMCLCTWPNVSCQRDWIFDRRLNFSLNFLINFLIKFSIKSLIEFFIKGLIIFLFLFWIKFPIKFLIKV